MSSTGRATVTLGVSHRGDAASHGQGDARGAARERRAQPGHQRLLRLTAREPARKPPLPSSSVDGRQAVRPGAPPCPHERSTTCPHASARSPCSPPWWCCARRACGCRDAGPLTGMSAPASASALTRPAEGHVRPRRQLPHRRRRTRRRSTTSACKGPGGFSTGMLTSVPFKGTPRRSR